MVRVRHNEGTRAVRIHALVHKALPHHGAGAESYLHAVLKWLTSRGHSCSASVTHADSAWTLDGVAYVGEPRFSTEPIEAADVLITHLDMTRLAMRAAERHGKPIVHLVHNHLQLSFHRVRPHHAQLVVANSRWIHRAIDWAGESLVLPPPVFAEDYRVGAALADALVLVNLSEAKGAPLFWELARRNPHRRFIGVLGAYGEQVVEVPVPDNVEVWENRADPLDFYERARVILMPSAYESWGRVPIEAAASGIPTIAHPTEGLIESLGPAGLYAARDCVEDWQWALDSLDDPVRYSIASCDARLRSKQLDPVPSLLRFEDALHDVIKRGRPIRRGSSNPKAALR